MKSFTVPFAPLSSVCFGRLTAIGVCAAAASLTPALTLYTATIDASLVSQAAVNNQYGFASFAPPGTDVGSSSGNADHDGSTQTFNVPMRVRGVAHVEGWTDAPFGVSEHSASTSGHLNLANLSGPGNPSFPNPAPYSPDLMLTWSFTLTVSCTLADEISMVTVSASVPGGPALAPFTLIQEGPGTQTVTINGSAPYNPQIPGNSIVARYLDVHADGYAITPEAVPEPGTMAALGIGVAALLRRRKRA